MSDQSSGAPLPGGGARATTSRRAVLSLVAGALGLTAWPMARARTASPLMLATSYKPGTDLAHYAASEKYDGIRGYWDGRKLWTRGGEPVNAPAWFTSDWPTQPMDGELWAGRGHFAHAVSTARRDVPDDSAWRQMKFMVFDLPAQPGKFSARSTALQQLLMTSPPERLVAVQQIHLRDHAGAQGMMDRIVAEGGEGIVLHRLDAPYRAGRSPDLLKYKPDDDADARVIGHVPGRGKYEGQMGALLLETPEGLKFKLGTGFDDATRRKPPAV
ncbi:MAG: DNA ligase, partial [Haliea sp.]